MTGLREFLWPYLIAQGVSFIFLIVALKNTRLARVFISLLFLWASGTNMYYGLTNPDIYLDYAPTAVPFYRDFINGWFSRNAFLLIPLIALCQFAIGLGMLWRNRWVKWSAIGAIVFLLSIAPLLVGSGFPFSITVSIAVILVLKKDDRRPIVFFKTRDMNHSEN